jgi:F-type H+-transporting ATPase subunit b
VACASRRCGPSQPGSAKCWRTQIEQQAQERARDILAQAEKNTQQAVAQAKAELRAEVADLAILAAERVVGQSMDTATNRQLVQEFVAQSKELQC